MKIFTHHFADNAANFTKALVLVLLGGLLTDHTGVQDVGRHRLFPFFYLKEREKGWKIQDSFSCQRRCAVILCYVCFTFLPAGVEVGVV